MSERTKYAVCYGEVLWDNLPGGKKPGGAPMNVAYHLKKCGINSYLISRIGNDQNGEELKRVLQGLDINDNYCQVDETQPTSLVEVVISPENEVSYDIVYPAAWDFIAFEEQLKPLVANADAFVYGSLSGRNNVTRETLSQLLDLSTFNVFDVNLRAPFYEEAYITFLLEKTNLLKLNLQELNLLAGWSQESYNKESDKVKFLQEKFAIKEIIVTKGSAGASYYDETTQLHHDAYPIQVKDTIGSGDSFLAAFLSKKLNGEPDTLKFASAVAAFVTTQPGACPPYTILDIQQFLSNIQAQSNSHPDSSAI